MDVRSIHYDMEGVAAEVDDPVALPPDGWVWVDVVVGPNEIDDLRTLADELGLDPLAVTDAVTDVDLPKVDDFGHQLLLVLHGLRDDGIGTYEVDCFLTRRRLTTIHATKSPAIDRLWSELQRRPELARGGPDDLTARLADVMTRRLLAVVDAFDDRIEGMVEQALAADAGLVADVTAVRADLTTVRKVVHPQREALDVMRSSGSEVVSDIARRRFSDVFDVAVRVVAGLDAARTALSETLDAYRGAEARVATDVSKVLTVYAAVLLPLSLIVGFFGMNYENLPTAGTDWGWIAVTVAMVVVAAVSLGIFVAVGWIRRPSGRQAGATLGRGLAEAARTPAQIAGAVYEISALPLRRVSTRSVREELVHRRARSDGAAGT